jgi:hypothetical protein
MTLAQPSRVVDRPVAEQRLPALALFPPVRYPRQRLELTQVKRVPSALRPRQEQKRFLNMLRRPTSETHQRAELLSMPPARSGHRTSVATAVAFTRRLHSRASKEGEQPWPLPQL